MKVIDLNKIYYCLLSLLIISCTTAGPGLFGKKSFHQQYGEKLIEAGLKETSLGTLWFSAAEKALNQPVTVVLPYKELGYFAAEKPSATGLRFKAKRGEKLLFEIVKRPANNFLLFTEIYKVDNEGKPSYLQSFDTALTKFNYEIDEAGDYIIRIQPELLKTGDYTLSISVGSVLGFPVAGNNARIGSVWGDARDAGARSHEGIDIFAPKRTPAIAAYDGTVTRVNENNLGGKTVWLRPKGKNYTLYYAHLDEQLTTAGASVQKGDTIGLVGNTGNAITTPPHLHFGIYSTGGAIDPLPFVNPKVKTASEVSASPDLLKKDFRLKRNYEFKTENHSTIIDKNTFVTPVGISSNNYRVELPDGVTIALPASVLETTNGVLKQGKLKSDGFIYNDPDINSPRKIQVKANETIRIVAFFKEFAFVSVGEVNGWVPKNAII